LTSSYYRGAHGAILMYDATNRASFENLEYWLHEINHNANMPHLVKVLVGSKLDFPRESLKVSRSEGEIFAIEHSMLFHEISNKNGRGVDDCFYELIETIMDDPHLVKLGGSEGHRLTNKDSNYLNINSCTSC
jgi:Ras-related protein Rab-2A